LLSAIQRDGSYRYINCENIETLDEKIDAAQTIERRFCGLNLSESFSGSEKEKSAKRINVNSPAIYCRVKYGKCKSREGRKINYPSSLTGL
jgi:hypothetical protein